MVNEDRSCLSCRWAEWGKTKNGRRHPSGEGRCGFDLASIVVKVPVAHKWRLHALLNSGTVGVISRKEPFVQCEAWEQEAA